VADFTIRGQRVAHVQIGVGDARLAENLYAVVHAAASRPTVFHQSDGAIGELKNAERIVFGLRFVGVDVGTHLTVNGFNGRTAEKPVAECDAVTAEVHQRATAGTINVPEPGAMRAKVFLTLFDEVNFSERARVGHFFGL